MQEIGLPMTLSQIMGLQQLGNLQTETEDDINHFKAEWDRETVHFFEKFVNSSEICTFFDDWLIGDGNIIFSTTFYYAHTPL